MGKCRDVKPTCAEFSQLQKDLFIMTTSTVFRNLDEEGKYEITPEIRKVFEAGAMLIEAKCKDIPWREWNAWLRNKVLEYLKLKSAVKSKRRRSKSGSTMSCTSLNKKN